MPGMTYSVSGGDKLTETLGEIAANLGKAKVVNVGFLEGAKYPDGTSVAQVAFWNEYGTHNADGTVHTPPRPFFRGMIQDKSPEWPKAIGDALVRNKYDAAKTLDQVGEAVAGQLGEAILKFDGVPLAPATIAAKGFSKQLVDSGLMSNSVRHEVK